MPLAKPTTSVSRFITFASLVLVVAVLRVAEDVMIPIALAFLLAFLLTPLVVRLTRWRLPKSVAIITTVTLAFVAIGAAGWQIANQAVALIGELPEYETNLQRKISVLKKPQAASSLTRAVDSLEKMWGDLQASAPEPEQAADKGAPVPVEVKTSDRTSFETGKQILGSLFKPLGTAGIVIVFVIVILFQREDLRNRLIRLISGGQLNVATEAVDDAAKRVSRYLLAQLMVNTAYGIAIGLGLWAIGIPHPVLWGTLATLLRFIPFVGPLIAASFPLVLSIAVDPGWTMLFWTAGLFIAVELLTNNVVEVLVYGTSTGISTLALLIAAVFWSWLWGMPGLFLSMPLTVCLLVIGQYVPGLKFLSVLLGSEPALQPSAQFYQTMLSMKQEEMFDQATEYVEQHSLTAFYDEVFVPALLMSEVDRHNGVLAEVRQKFICESGQDLIEELSERTVERQKDEANAAIGPQLLPDAAALPPVIGIPARDEADELVALMLAHLLRDSGIAATVVSATDHPETYGHRLKSEKAVVFVSALPPSTLSGAGRVCRRVKHENASVKVLVGVWSSEAKIESLKRRLDPAGADGIATRLSEALLQMKNLLAIPSKSKVPEVETPNTQALERTEVKLATNKPEEATDTVTRELARAFNVPISLVSVIETDRDFWRSTSGGGSTAPMPQAESTVTEAVFASDNLLVVEDVEKEERYSSNPLLVKRGVRAFASAPLRARSGHLVGNLCILDTQPREFSPAERELLESLATQLMETVEPEGQTTEPSPALT
jgi:predicted PurR-regulated permease PerM